MTVELAIGAACGLATIVVSEALLRLPGEAWRTDLFRALAIGAALRTLWVLAVLAMALTHGIEHPGAFVPALMLGYLAGQVLEGIRYTRVLGEG